MTAESNEMSQTQLVRRVFELTEAINQAGQIADWQLAARLAEERSPLVHSIKAQQDAGSLGLIRRIQAMDSTLMEDAQVVQAGLTKEFHAAMGRATAAQQYNRVAML
jgi:flagellar protein FliT